MSLIVRSPVNYMADLAGRPLENGKLYFGVSGQDPELHPIDVFWDESLTQTVTQPATTTAGYVVHNGQRARVYTAAPTCSLRIRDKSNAQVEYFTTVPATGNSSLIDVRDYGAVAGSTADQTSLIEAAFAAALSSGVGRIEGGGGTYYVTYTAVTVAGTLTVDNMTLKEYNPNPGSGSPVTITFTAQTPGTGTLILGTGFRVDRSGDGTKGDLNTACGIQVVDVDHVIARCEIFGNAKGTGIIVDRANWFYDDSYVHDSFCDHTGITDDIQQGSWARYCENVITRGRVTKLGGLDRASTSRDRYNRGRSYAGCKNIDLGGIAGPYIDQAYDVTGDANNGNCCVKINGAHISYCLSSGIAIKNATLATASGCATIIEPGLCGVLFSGPADALVNMTKGGILSGITQIGGGSNGYWVGLGSGPASVVKLAVQGGSSPENSYPRGIHVTGNTYVYLNGSTTFTVADTDELTPDLSAPLNVHDFARVRLTTTGTLPTGLATGTDYWIVLVDGGTFHLATSFINAQDGTYITGLTGGSGTHTITVQNDCNYGVISENVYYDKLAPNLVYGNNFGPVIASQANVLPLKAVISNSGNQSIASATATDLDGDTASDPYGITIHGSGAIEFTVPFEGNWHIRCNGEWSGGATPTGYQQLRLSADTGSGFADVPGYLEKQACSATDERQTLNWWGYPRAGYKYRIRATQTYGSSKNFALKEFLVEYLP